VAYYQDTNEVRYKLSEDFRPIYRPGARVPYSGIYTCRNCKDEIASNAGDPFPPQNQRQHTDITRPSHSVRTLPFWWIDLTLDVGLAL
jgi:hypothetical protein